MLCHGKNTGWRAYYDLLFWLLRMKSQVVFESSVINNWECTLSPLSVCWYHSDIYLSGNTEILKEMLVHRNSDLLCGLLSNRYGRM